MNIAYPSEAHRKFAEHFHKRSKHKERYGIFDVRSLMVGKLKVKESSKLIYAGHTFDVLGLYMVWPNVGLRTDGQKEYRVSLLGTGFSEPDSYPQTCISESDIEWIKADEIGPEEKEGLVRLKDMEKMLREISENDAIDQAACEAVLMVARKYGVNIQ